MCQSKTLEIIAFEVDGDMKTKIYLNVCLGKLDFVSWLQQIPKYLHRYPEDRVQRERWQKLFPALLRGVVPPLHPAHGQVEEGERGRAKHELVYQALLGHGGGGGAHQAGVEPAVPPVEERAVHGRPEEGVPGREQTV